MLRLRWPRWGHRRMAFASAMLLMVFVAGGVAGAVWMRNFADTSVSVRQSGGVTWHNNEAGSEVSTLVTGYGTCTWAPQVFGTFYKTATISFADAWDGSQCIVGRQVGEGGTLFIANQDEHHRINVTSFDFGSSGDFCAPGGGCPIEVSLLNGPSESSPPLSFPFIMNINETRNIQVVLTVNGAYATSGTSYHDLRLGFLASVVPGPPPTPLSTPLG